MRKVAKKVCKLSLFSQLSAPIKSGVRRSDQFGVIQPQIHVYVPGAAVIHTYPGATAAAIP